MSSEHFSGNVGVKAIIVNNGKILLTRDHKDTDRWDLPGGRIHTGEDVLHALEREAQEELGVAVSVGRFIDSCQVVHTQAGSNHLFLTFEATLVDPNASFQIPSEELAEVRWLGKEQLAELTIYENCLRAMKLYWGLK